MRVKYLVLMLNFFIKSIKQFKKAFCFSKLVDSNKKFLQVIYQRWRCKSLAGSRHANWNLSLLFENFAAFYLFLLLL